MGRNKALILAAVVMALAAATTAHAYYETWTGWYSQGTIYYNGNAYTRNGEGGDVYDTTYSAYRDTVYSFNGVGHFLFVYSAGSDSIILYVTSLYGGKDTGTTGTKDGSGDWEAYAVRKKNGIENTWYGITGTWDTEGSDCFDYNDTPPTYDANWDIDPTMFLSGGGTSTGYRSDYEP